jgi:hypothetical protein
MGNIVQNISDRWVEIIESIDWNGYKRSVVLKSICRVENYFNNPFHRSSHTEKYLTDVDVRSCIELKFNTPESTKGEYKWKILLINSFLTELKVDGMMPTRFCDNEYHFRNYAVDFFKLTPESIKIQFYPQAFLPIHRDRQISKIMS